MKAGRELDALIAEKVMGQDITLHDEHSWEPFMGEFIPGLEEGGSKMCAHCFLLWFNENDEPSDTPCIPSLSEFSTDIAAAWTVLEKLREAKFSVTITGYWEGSTGKWWVNVMENVESAANTNADTAQLAICLAALEAVDAE